MATSLAPSAGEHIDDDCIRQLQQLFLQHQHETMRISPDRERILLMLDLFLPEYQWWGNDGRSRSVEHLLTEVIDDCETELYLIDAFTAQGIGPLFRRIETVTIRVVCDIQGTRHLLKECKLKEGFWQERAYQNSMSEKLKCNDDSHSAAVRRALFEELGLVVTNEHLEPPYLYPVPPEVRDMEHQMSQISAFPPRMMEDCSLHISTKFPGLHTWNRLHHFYWVMPAEYYVAGGYEDLGTGHMFRWCPISGPAINDTNE